MQSIRVEHPARAPAVVRVQDQPPCAHQDKLLLQRQRQQQQLGAQHGHGRPAGALRGHGRLAGAHGGHTRGGDGRVAAVQLGRGVLADHRRRAWRGLPGNWRVGGKGARYHLPNARTVLHGGTRAALHVRGRRGGRCVLLAPFAPLARLGWTLPRLPVFGSRTPY
jgi:hypothetical protein